MNSIVEVEKLALDLSETDRALLASRLLRSLPAVLCDDDDGYTEAHRRDGEMDTDAEASITHDQLRQLLRGRLS